MGALTKVTINKLYRLFQYFSANAATTISFINYKSRLLRPHPLSKCTVQPSIP